MMRGAKRTAFLLVALLGVLQAPVWAEADVAAAGRAIVAAHQDAVVTIQLVIKEKYNMLGMGSDESESKAEAFGTVLDPTGLTVTSLSSIDPSQLVKAMMSALGETDTNQISTEITDLRLLLPDGTEVPARVVLRDRVLDLAYIRPLNPISKPLVCVDLTAAGKAEQLDQVVLLGRMGRIASRSPFASIGRIGAVVEKPRLFYVLANTAGGTFLGSPVFGLDGKALGIMVIRSTSIAGGSLSVLADLTGSLMLPIIVPAEDVLEGAAQAPPADASAQDEEGSAPPAPMQSEQQPETSPDP